MLEITFSIVSYYLAFYFEYINLCSLCNKKLKFSIKSIVFIGFIAAINYLLTLSGIVLVKIIFSFCSLFLICRFLLREKTDASLLSSLIYYLIIVVIEYFMSLIIVNVLKYNPDKYLISVGIQKCIIGHIMNVITFAIFRLKVFRLIYAKSVYLINKSGIKKAYIYCFLASLFIIQMMYTANIAGKIEVIYAALYIVVYISFLIYLVVSMNKNNYLKLLNTFLEDKDEDMQKLIDNYRMFQHNIKNDLIAISSVSTKKVKSMIEDLIGQYNLASNNYCKISNMPKGLKGVIYHKIVNNSINPSSIIVDNYINKDPLDVLNIKVYRKLIESFGIIVDNAVEAVHNENDFIYILLIETEDAYKIKCSNTFSNQVDIDKISEKGKTTKKEHMGFGIYYIKNKTDFKFKSKVINGLFTVELIIEK